MKKFFNVKDISMILLGSLILAIGFNVFFIPNNLVAGGVSGIAIVINNVFNIEAWLTVLVLNIILFLVGWYYLGNEFAIKTVLGTLAFPMFMKLTENLDIVSNDILLSSIYGGFLVGLGIGLVFKVGATTGGADILPKIMYKYFHIPVGQGVFIIDAIVISIGWYIFGIEMILYALISLVIASFVLDKVVVGITSSKAVYIISEHYEEIKDYIFNHLDRGVTLLQATGGYTENNKNIVLSVVKSREYLKLKNAVNSIDSKAFIIISDAKEVHGEGFID